MNTIKTKCDKNNIKLSELEKAKEILKNGGLVAFPTETVYGLGGNALDSSASKKIYAAKGRPSDNPLIVHISCEKDLAPLVKEIPEAAEKLMKKYWPGPMTLVFKKSDIVPSETTGGLGTVAIRMPSHPIANKLIEVCGFPIAAPSANSSGRPSPTSAEHVISDLDGKIDMIIDGGISDIGLESTIIDVTEDPPTLLRPGYISLEEIAKLCGSVGSDKGIFEKPKEDFKPKAPGMKYRHYAPNAPMTIVSGKTDKVLEKIKELARASGADGKKVGIICSDETAEKISEKNFSAQKDKCGGVTILTYGKRNDGISTAKNLYDILRRMDEEGVEEIFAEGYEGNVMKGAIDNRMLKAAGFNEIKL